jgi:hypothetical protein
MVKDAESQLARTASAETGGAQPRHALAYEVEKGMKEHGDSSTPRRNQTRAEVAKVASR